MLERIKIGTKLLLNKEEHTVVRFHRIGSRFWMAVKTDKLNWVHIEVCNNELRFAGDEFWLPVEILEE